MKTLRFASPLAIAAALLAAPAFAATYGKGVSDATPVKVSEMIASPDKYVGKVVKVEGTVTEVCAKRGCWMLIAGDKEFQTIRFKVDDGVIVIPMDAKGKKAAVEGTFSKVEMSKEQSLEYQKHLAEENKKPFDPKSVTGPTTLFSLKGTGAVIN